MRCLAPTAPVATPPRHIPAPSPVATAARRALCPARSIRCARAQAAASMSSLFGHSSTRAAAQLAQPQAGGDSAAAVVRIVAATQGADVAAAAPAPAAAWAAANSFSGDKAGEVLLVPDAETGALGSVLLGLGPAGDLQRGSSQLWAFAALPNKLPRGHTYALAPSGRHAGAAAYDPQAALLGWMLGCYKFSRYKTGKLPDGKAGSSSNSNSNSDTSSEPKPLLLPPEGADTAAATALAGAFYWARDMINTPAEDMGPQHLAAEAAALAAAHEGAKVTVLTGEELLAANYPAIHTVGRAAARPPCLIELTWQPPSGSGSGSGAGTQLPLVALVGKGVCFDTGGLDIKTAAGMKLMKKDMGGGALVLALASVVMAAQLPVRLRMLVPAVENAISGSAYRPGDVLQTRAGITVENGNTDAEGRLILCDALWEAAHPGNGQAPDVIIDAATLTGAARVALGPELPAVFSSCDATFAQLEAAATAEGDPLWRLPLHASYNKMLESKVADINSTGEPGSAGAITAALFLARFAQEAKAWVHIDTAGWVAGGSAGPGRPEGGEALGLRALWRFLQDRYARPPSAQQQP